MLLSLGTCRIDLLRGLVSREEREVPLTTREGELLAYLAERPYAPVSRDEILREVWGYSDAVVTRACDNTVRRLREKVEEDPQSPRHILTVYGLGYRFVPGGEPAQALAPPKDEPRERSFTLGARRVDLARGVVVSGDERDALTAKEIALLERLHAGRGAVVERLALMRAVGSEASPRSVDNLVVRLRKKLEPDPSDPVYLLTAPGGYRLDLGSAEEDLAPRGREALFAEIRRASAQHPFVLLYGPPGVGKSLLASAWARATGATWVDLRGVSAAEEIALRVAQALDLSLGQADPSARIAQALASAARNIVLDALDAGLSEIGALVERWTADAREVRLLATAQSLSALSAPGLCALEVPALEPEAAVELFVQKMRRKQTREALDLSLVRQIVEQLDCLPLSVELAAARTAVSSLPALAESLAEGLVAEPEAHRSLQTSLEEALSRLDAEELAAIDVLSIPKTFDIEDAEHLLGGQALDLVQSLRDRSLLREEPDSGHTLRFTVWQVLRAQLASLRERSPDRGRSAVEKVIAVLAAFADEGESGPPSLECRERMRVRLGDLARAVGLGLEHQIPLAARCAIGAASWYNWYGPARAGIGLCERALSLPGLDPADERMLYYLAGRLHFDANQDSQAVDCLTAAIEGAGEHDLWLAYHARGTLSTVYKGLCDDERSRALIEESERLARSAGDHAYADIARARALSVAGAFEEAIVWYESCIRHASDARDFVTFSHYGIGTAAHRLGRLSVAAEHLSIASERWEGLDTPNWLRLQGFRAAVLAKQGAREELERVASATVEEARRDGKRYTEAVAYLYLGSVRLFDGALGPAREALARSRTLLDSFEGVQMMYSYLEGRSADLALMEGRPQIAADLAARVEQIALATRDASAALYGSHCAAVAALDLGDPGEAARRLAQAEGAIEPLPSRFDVGVHSARWALVAARLGQTEVSERLDQRAEDLIPHTGVTPRSELCWWLRATRAARG